MQVISLNHSTLQSTLKLQLILWPVTKNVCDIVVHAFKVNFIGQRTDKELTCSWGNFTTLRKKVGQRENLGQSDQFKELTENYS